MNELISPVSLPALPRNRRAGKFVAAVRELGYVPFCVQDAFSWLTPAVPALSGQIQAVVQAALAAGLQPSRAGDEELLALDGITPRRVTVFRAWLSAGGPGNDVQRDHGPLPADGERCSDCVFQSPSWSQCHAKCSHSWLHDHDGDCRAFVGHDYLLGLNPGYARFCPKPRVMGWAYDIFPDVFPGWKRWDELPEATCNLPSHYYARLNLREWYDGRAVQAGYWAVERERLRRFAEWANDEALREAGVEAAQSFLPGF